MATYRVQGPDGATYRFQAPDDATQEQLQSYVQQNLAKPAAAAPPDSVEHDAKVAQQRADDAKLYDPLNGTSWGERAMINLGAGVDTLVQGTKGLAHDKLGLGPGVTDEQIDEKRQRDAHLADADPWTGKPLQIAGQTLPMLAAAHLAGPLGMAALTRMGVTGAASTVGPLTKAVATGAAGGAGAAALDPVKSDESRGGNMAVAGTIGAALPGAGQLVGKGVGEGWKVLRQAGGTKRAAEWIAEKLPAGYTPRLAGVADEARVNVPNPSGRGSKEFTAPHSAVQATGDAELAPLEAWSRSRPSTQPNWARFDATRNEGLYRATQDMAPSELRLDRLRAVREGRTGPLRQTALQDAAQQADFAQPVLAHADQLIQGATGANQSVEMIADYVRRTLGPDARGAVTPERLYEVRKVLTDKLGKTGITDELGSAAKGARRETVGMVQAIDDALDQATGGKWSPYLNEYAERSRPITSGTALRDVAETMSEKPLKGTTPEVTAHGYGKAVAANTESKYGSKLVPEHQQGTDDLLESLKRAEAAARTRKLSATMGGGSITNTDQQLAGLGGRLLDALTGMRGGAGVLSLAAERVGRINQDVVETEIARLLQQPTQLAAELRRIPPDYRTRVVQAALREASLTGGASTGVAAAGH